MIAQALEAVQIRPTQGEWTYEDFLRLPDDGKRYEIIEGVLYVTNAPNSNHQFAVTEITSELRNFVKTKRLGRVTVAPFEVHLAPRTRPVQPDVMFIRAERVPAGPFAYFDGTPDLIVEVLSPESIRRDRITKFTAYEAGVLEYWIVNPHARIVEVYVLSAGEYALLGEFGDNEQIQSQVLSGIDIVAKTLFA